MSLSAEEKAFFDANYVLKAGVSEPETTRRVRDEIEDLHEHMAEDPAEGVGVGWEEFGTRIFRR